MRITRAVQNLLKNYNTDSPGVKTNLARILMQGRAGGSGRVVIYPVDQGFEHGPDRSFAMNPAAYDPHYHFKFALDAGMSAYAAPLGWLEAGADTFAGRIPFILKMNSSNALLSEDCDPDQAITADVQDALRLGCSAIGLTIYPGSDASLGMFEQIAEIILEAKSYGLPTILWSYARGSMSKAGETGLDIISYGAHMAALLGAHVIKVKFPSTHIETPEAKKHLEKNGIDYRLPANRIAHVVRSCFNGRRLVVFSGGEAKGRDVILDEARAIRLGGGNGSIIARNCFQRPRDEALSLISDLSKIYNAAS